MVAITRDDRKIRLYSVSKAGQSGIEIYSASGNLIHTIKVRLILMGSDSSGTKER